MLNRNNTNSTINVFVNGTSLGEETYTETYSGTTGLKTIIGTRIYNGVHYYDSSSLDGQIYEYIVINKSLSSNELTQINYYLSKKWELEETVDSDGDSYTDAIEETAGTSPTDASSYPTVDFSNTVDGFLDEPSGFDSLEANLQGYGLMHRILMVY